MSTSRPTTTKRSSSSPVSSGRQSPTPSNGRRSPTTSRAASPNPTTSRGASPKPKPKATPSTTLTSKPTTKTTLPSPSATVGRTPQRTKSTPISTREKSPKPPVRAPAVKPKVLGPDKGSKSVKSSVTRPYSRSKSDAGRNSLDKKTEALSSSVDHTNPVSITEVPITETDHIEEKEEINELPIFVEVSPKDENESSVVEEVGEDEELEEVASHDDVDTSPLPQQLIDEKHLEEHVLDEEAEKDEKAEEIEETMTEDEGKEETIMEIDEGTEEPMPIEPVQETVMEKTVVVAVVKEPPPKQEVVVGKRMESAQNDVIEKAKSKFLEKRKNKVLALVGAFETVMALQEPEGQTTQRKTEEEGSDAPVSEST